MPPPNGGSAGANRTRTAVTDRGTGRAQLDGRENVPGARGR